MHHRCRLGEVSQREHRVLKVSQAHQPAAATRRLGPPLKRALQVDVFIGRPALAHHRQRRRLRTEMLSQQTSRSRGFISAGASHCHPHQSPSQPQHIRRLGTQRLTRDRSRRRPPRSQARRACTPKPHVAHRPYPLSSPYGDHSWPPRGPRPRPAEHNVWPARPRFSVRNVTV